MVYKNYRVKIALLYAKMPKITRTNWHCSYIGIVIVPMSGQKR